MEEPISLIQVFFNCCFYTILVPFRVKWNPKLECYTLNSYKFQKIVCGLFHIYILYFASQVLKVAFIQLANLNSSSSLGELFHLVMRISSQCMYLLCLKSMWFDQQAINKVINAFTFKTFSKQSVKLFQLLSKISGVIGFVVVTMAHYQMAQYYGEHLKLNEYNDDKSNIVYNPFEIWSKEVNRVWYALQVHALSFYSINHLFLLLLTISLMGLALEFQQYFSNEGSISIIQSLEKYRSMRQTVSHLNRVWGTKFLFFYLMVICFCGEFPDVVFGYRNDDSIISSGIYIVLNNLVFFIAAEFHAVVNRSFSDWSESCIHNFALINSPISDPMMTGRYHKEEIAIEIGRAIDIRMMLMHAKNELHSEPIAVACRFFHVTYSFLTSMVSLVVTYGIIIFQTRRPN